MTSGRLPSFERPPVVETVLGLQFDRLDAFRNAHLGRFWGELGPDWPEVEDAPPIQTTFERFDSDSMWEPIGGLRISQDSGVRLRIRNRERTRMIQIQNGRIHYNWLGQAGSTYPRYSAVRQEFDTVVRKFNDFVESHQLGSLNPNQWEVTYVNQIPKSQLWSTPADWPSVLSGLLAPVPTEGVEIESTSGSWHFRLAENAGRLHVEASHITRHDSGTEMIRLALTARGPGPLETGLDTGHAAIVHTFANITSAAAHEHWGVK